MKATGIVRRMDELGRVVIPKEIRRTLRIREGDPLEIFTDRDELMLKKYSPIATIEKFSESAAKSLAELSGKTAVVCDTDGVLFACGEGKRDFSGKTLSPEIDKLLKERKSYVASEADGGTLIPIAVPGDTSAETISAIIADEAAIGMVNTKTTAVRIIPAPGKTVGDRVEMGGLLGSAPVMPVHDKASEDFIARGGRIPAPLQSLKN